MWSVKQFWHGCSCELIALTVARTCLEVFSLQPTPKVFHRKWDIDLLVWKQIFLTRYLVLRKLKRRGSLIHEILFHEPAPQSAQNNLQFFSHERQHGIFQLKDLQEKSKYFWYGNKHIAISYGQRVLQSCLKDIEKVNFGYMWFGPPPPFLHTYTPVSSTQDPEQNSKACKITKIESSNQHNPWLSMNLWNSLTHFKIPGLFHDFWSDWNFPYFFPDCGKKVRNQEISHNFSENIIDPYRS